MRPLVWFRSDLRVTDNPALHDACATARRGVIGVFVICPEQWAEHDWADIKVDFVLRHLSLLSRTLETLGVPLLVRVADRFDDVPETLLDVARRHGCDGIHFNREYEINERRRDRAVVERFEREGLETRAFTDQVVISPGALRTGRGDFYTVFSPFKRAWIARVQEQGIPTPLGRPRRQPDLPTSPDAIPDGVAGFATDPPGADLWPAGEQAARRRLKRFTADRIDAYKDERDLPAVDGTSALSPYLSAGSISIRQCLQAAADAMNGRIDDGRPGPKTWVSELIWREFYRHVMVGFPRVCRHRAFRPNTDAVPWRDDDEAFIAWTEGRTGFPIVDAGMRQLRETGWMHNRMRMVTAMFLSKDLLIDWRRGERHFMRHLVDGDLASNNGGWQWSSSTGTDAAPYFRIFNPTTQGRRFDADGVFIRRYVAELADVEGDAIHDPPPLVRAGAGYPEPIVDHAAARERAIAAFKET